MVRFGNRRRMSRARCRFPSCTADLVPLLSRAPGFLRLPRRTVLSIDLSHGLVTAAVPYPGKGRRVVTT